MDGIPPVSQELDEDMMMIRVARELGVPVTMMDRLPAHWIGSAMTEMEWRRLENEKQSKRSRRKPSVNPGRKRG